MPIKKVAGTGLKILAVCLLFTVCMAVGVSLSGLDRAAQQGRPAQTSSQVSPPTPPATEPIPGKIFLPLLVFSLCVGTVESYVILRSSWYGWTLAGAIFVGTYGISTVVNQIESMFFLSNKFPPGLISAIFLQGAIATALFAPLAVLVLGKWRVPVPAPPPAPARMRAASRGESPCWSSRSCSCTCSLATTWPGRTLNCGRTMAARNGHPSSHL